MNETLKKSISTAEKNNWELEYFENHYAVVSRPKDTIWKRKYNTLKQSINTKCELQACDDHAVLMLWDDKGTE